MLGSFLTAQSRGGCLPNGGLRLEIPSEISAKLKLEVVAGEVDKRLAINSGSRISLADGSSLSIEAGRGGD